MRGTRLPHGIDTTLTCEPLKTEFYQGVDHYELNLNSRKLYVGHPTIWSYDLPTLLYLSMEKFAEPRRQPVVVAVMLTCSTSDFVV